MRLQEEEEEEEEEEQEQEEEDVALPVVRRGAGWTGAWQAGDGGHDLSQGASL